MTLILYIAPKGVFFMRKNAFSARELAIAAGLSAVSAATQLVHIGYQSPQFGMWIDIVAVTWVIAFLLFGIRMGFLVSATGALIITLFAPDTWLGASMKWVASFPMLLVMSAWIYMLKRNIGHYSKIINLAFPVLVALGVRLLLVIPLNYYYAIPIWTGMTPEAAISAIPWYIIALFNIVQGVIDVAAAWILVYKFKLNRFARNEK